MGRGGGDGEGVGGDSEGVGGDSEGEAAEGCDGGACEILLCLSHSR